MPGLPLDPAWKVPPSQRTAIVLVHGAVVNGWEMALLRRRLRRLGARVHQFQYRSMRIGLKENVQLLRRFIHATEGDVVHVVGHSMGGVLLRNAFEEHPDPRPGRLIAVGSPLLDCWVGHRVKALHGRAHFLVGKTVHDHIRQKPDPVWRGARDFGVVAGTYPFGIGRLFPGLPQPSDGVVLLEETRLRGIAGHVTYRINHFGLIASRRCFAQIAQFLATGAFAPVAQAEAMARPLETSA
jgi:pimeloyl-ACP methyl ester carboxylesterase